MFIYDSPFPRLNSKVRYKTALERAGFEVNYPNEPTAGAKYARRYASDSPARQFSGSLDKHSLESPRRHENRYLPLESAHSEGSPAKSALPDPIEQLHNDYETVDLSDPEPTSMPETPAAATLVFSPAIDPPLSFEALEPLKDDRVEEYVGHLDNKIHSADPDDHQALGVSHTKTDINHSLLVEEKGPETNNSQGSVREVNVMGANTMDDDIAHELEPHVMLEEMTEMQNILPSESSTTQLSTEYEAVERPDIIIDDNSNLVDHTREEEELDFSTPSGADSGQVNTPTNDELQKMLSELATFSDKKQRELELQQDRSIDSSHYKKSSAYIAEAPDLEPQGLGIISESKPSVIDNEIQKYPAGEGPCRQCGLEIRADQKRVYVKKNDELSGQWHRECFLCTNCDITFDKYTPCYIKDDHPYCKQHYHQVNDSLCHVCKLGIEGECLENNMKQKFHTECLTCVFCHNVIEEEYFIINGKLALCAHHDLDKLLAVDGFIDSLSLRPEGDEPKPLSRTHTVAKRLTRRISIAL